MHLEARDVGQLLKCVGTQFSPVQERVCFVINRLLVWSKGFLSSSFQMQWKAGLHTTYMLLQ